MSETGDAFVSLVVEASKNLLKYYPSLLLPLKEKKDTISGQPGSNLAYPRSHQRSQSFHDIPTNGNSNPRYISIFK